MVDENGRRGKMKKKGIVGDNDRGRMKMEKMRGKIRKD